MKLAAEVTPYRFSPSENPGASAFRLIDSSKSFITAASRAIAAIAAIAAGAAGAAHLPHLDANSWVAALQSPMGDLETAALEAERAGEMSND